MLQANDLLGRHAGHPGFVIGTGMSVSVLLDELLVPPQAFDEEIVLGCKQIHRDFKLSYWVCMDTAFHLREQNKIAQKSFTKFVPYNESIDEDIPPDPNRISLPHKEPISSPDTVAESFDDLCIASDTGVIALRIAYLLGLNPIYLIGLSDNIYKGKLHYHSESKRIVAEQTVTTMGNELIPFIEAISEKGTQVISCSPISILNAVVPYVDVRTVLKSFNTAPTRNTK